MDLVMQVEIPAELYHHFVKQAEIRHCTVEEIVRETIRKFLSKED